MCDFDDFFDDFGDWEDFAIIGGIIGYFEDQYEEEEILDRINEGLDPYDDIP